jgi:phosphate transport system substrate-binding protein
MRANSRTRRLLLTPAAVTLVTFCAQAQSLPDLPEYKPEQKASQVLRSWGSDDMADLMKSWETGFHKFQPEVQFVDTLKGSETAQAALYTDVADLALMGREILPLEWYPLFRRKHHFPLEITVATGSYDVANKTFALTVFVNQDNPISKLTLKQLDGIFGEQRSGGWDSRLQWHADLARGVEENIRTWGQLGLTAEWKDQPIHVYGYPNTLWAPSGVAPGAVQFFRNRVLGGADKWNSELIEFDQGELIAAAVGKDRFGIAYAGMPYATPSIKPIALAVADNGIYVEPTRANLANRTYPLTRSIYVYIDRVPGQPVDPKVKEFLRYVLSRDGQQLVAQDHGYLPLTADEVRTQLRKLE